MYWLFTDETNREPSQGDYFIYGGLILTPEQMAEASVAVSKIRSRYGFRAEDQFKFQTKSRPDHLDRETWTAAKHEAIRALESIGAVLMIYVVLHAIARKRPAETIREWALNSVLHHFDHRFLAHHEDVGAVCIDRDKPKFDYSYLKRKFQCGVEMPGGRTSRLERILHYSVTCDGASHLSSLTDIALGSMRYCINTATGTGDQEVARKMMPALGRMMWSEVRPDGNRQVGGYGFIQYPKKIKIELHRRRYSDLVTSLERFASTAPVMSERVPS